MEIKYSSEKVEQQCTSVQSANKLFGGNKALATSLLARVNALKNAQTIKDIIVQPSFRFHDLKHKNKRNLEGYFAIDVKTKKEPWRIILQPLDKNRQPYVPFNIDELAETVKIIEILEVSQHYE